MDTLETYVWLQLAPAGAPAKLPHSLRRPDAIET